MSAGEILGGLLAAVLAFGALVFVWAHLTPAPDYAKVARDG